MCRAERWKLNVGRWMLNANIWWSSWYWIGKCVSFKTGVPDVTLRCWHCLCKPCKRSVWVLGGLGEVTWLRPVHWGEVGDGRWAFRGLIQYKDDILGFIHIVASSLSIHDDSMTWKFFPHYWPFVRGIHYWRFIKGIHWSSVASPHKWAIMQSFEVSLLFGLTNCWINSQVTGDLRCHDAHMLSP